MGKDLLEMTHEERKSFYILLSNNSFSYDSDRQGWFKYIARKLFLTLKR